MKIAASIQLIGQGAYARSPQWQQTLAFVTNAVQQAEWPPQGEPRHEPGVFKIYPESGKKSGEGNGVVPIKRRPMAILEQNGWLLERDWNLGVDPASLGQSDYAMKPGPIDAAFQSPDGLILVEWETGNVSSSHRSINKMALGLRARRCIAGIVIVPNRNLARYLTDRIGNVEELYPYFPFWQSVQVEEGVLQLLVVEHDQEDLLVPRIPKGRDGRAKEGADRKNGII